MLMPFICGLVFFSLSMLVVIGDFVLPFCSFNHIICTSTFHLRYHKTHDTTKTQLRSRRPPAVRTLRFNDVT